MSDRIDRTIRDYSSRFSGRPTRAVGLRGGLSDYERELQPFLQEEQEEAERTKIQPLRMILDILQRGQYVTANIAKEIQDSAQGKDETSIRDLGIAIWEGITGKRKGSFEHVLRDAGVTGKVFEGAPEGTRRAQMDWADVGGFVLDILLDPTTYMGLGGATKAARAGAKEYAEAMVKLTAKELAADPKNLAKVARSLGVDALGKTADDTARLMNRVYKNAYREGLAKTGEELGKKAGQRVTPFMGMADDEGLTSILKAANNPNLGRESSRFFGAQFLERGANPLKKIRVSDTWKKFAGWMDRGATGKFSDAVWSVMNKGPIGGIRKALGFRNPRQKYLRSLELEKGAKFADALRRDGMERYIRIAGELSDEQKKAVVNTFSEQEVLEGIGAPAWKAIVATGDDQVDDAVYKVRELMREVDEADNVAAMAMGRDAVEAREWYLPVLQRQRAGIGSPRAPREYMLEQHMSKEADRMAYILGISKDKASELVSSDKTGLVTNLDEMILTRMNTSANLRARANLIEQMKEFGIDLSDATDDAAKLLTANRQYTEMGLKQVDDAGLQNYLFDNDVADIIDRAIKITGPEQQKYFGGLKKYMSWWKGIITATPGFHGRNWMSNEAISFLEHGPRGMVKHKLHALAGTTYALRRGNPKTVLEPLGLNDRWLKSTLSDRMPNGKSILEVTDEFHKMGVVSESAMGHDALSTIDKMTKGKLSQPLRSASRAAGNVIENTPRLQSAMIDYEDLVRAGVPHEEAITRAGRNAKSRFLDYEDLTEFERKVMKNVIPFYTWMRKNLAAQIIGIKEHPELYSFLPKFRELLEYEDPDYDPKYAPEWMLQEGMFPIREREGKFQMFRPDFAHMDLNMIPLYWTEDRILPHFTFDELKKDIISAAAPWVKQIAGRMTTENGYNFFYRNQLGKTAEAPFFMRWLAETPSAIPMLDGLMRKAGIDNGLYLDESEGKLRMDAQFAQVLEEFIPILRQLEFAFYLPEVAIPGLEEGILAAINMDHDKDAAEELFQVLAFWSGIKMKDTDLEESKMRLGEDIVRQAEQNLREDRRRSPTYQRRNMNTPSRAGDLMRRLGG